jgi:hypothetical protein
VLPHAPGRMPERIKPGSIPRVMRPRPSHPQPKHPSVPKPHMPRRIESQFPTSHSSVPSVLPMPSPFPPAHHYGRDYMPGLGLWMSQARLAEQMNASSAPLEQPYTFAFNNPVNYIDPDGHKPSNSAAACFWRTYTRLNAPRGNQRFGPLKSCEIANQHCNSHIKCGPCGPYNTPSIPSNCLSYNAIPAFGKFLHDECGGEGADKLAHCWGCCMAVNCGASVTQSGVGWGLLVCSQLNHPPTSRDSIEDNAANAYGAQLGCSIRHDPIWNALPRGQACLLACARATHGLHFE